MNYILEATTNYRNSNTLKLFVEKYIGKGNTIVTDCWLGYASLVHADSGYSYDKHNHVQV